MTVRAFAVAFVLFVLLPGCMDDRAPDGPGTSTTDGPTRSDTASSSSGGPAPPLDNTTIPSEIVWTDCKSLGMRIDGPGGFFDVHTPPGWEPAFQPGSSISTIIYECARIAWGPYVRGPIFMMDEEHGEFDNPQSCSTNSGVTVRTILESIWFSDPDLVAYARDVYGMTAYHADFTHTRTDGDGVVTSTWTWAEPGGPTSEATFYDFAGDDNHTENFLTRIFWFNGAGISWMDFSEVYENDAMDTRSAKGLMHPPTLYGRSMPDPSFVTPNASLTGNHQITGTIARFGDMSCLEPL